MKMSRWERTLLLPAIAVAVTVSACGRSGEGLPESDESGLIIAVSISPQAWLVEKVGGDEVDVITLLSPGDSPATYQPTDFQISRLMQADIYLRIGIPFEKGRWLEAVEREGGVEIVDLRDGIPLRRMHHVHDEESPDDPGRSSEADEERDPHIWLTPALLKIQARTIARILGLRNPSNAENIQSNLARIMEELDRVDVYIRDRLKTFRGMAFYVFHPAWGYFADEYGLRQEAIEIEGKEPGDHELTEFQTMARRDRVSVIFIQPQISGESARAVARAVNADLKELDPLAYDVAANLRRVADAIAESYR